MAIDRLREEIARLDQEICSILTKKPRSTDDDDILQYKKQRLAEARNEEREIEREEREYKRQQEKEREEREYKRQQEKEDKEYERKMQGAQILLTIHLA